MAHRLLAKTDRLDAATIARYGAFAKPGPTPVRDPARQELAGLLAYLPTYRQRLIDEIPLGGNSWRISGAEPSEPKPRRRLPCCGANART